MAVIELIQKKSARYPENYTVRVSKEAKDKAHEMANDREMKIDVAEPVRKQIEATIDKLYELYLKAKAKG